MKKNILLVVSLALLGGALPGRAQQVILNGGFESPVVPTLSLLGIGLGPGAQTFTGAGITNWSVTSGSVTILDNGSTVVDALGLLVPPQGNQFAILNGLSINVLGLISVGGTGTVAQTFTTVAGNTYQVSFQYAGLNVSALNGTAALQVTVTNSNQSTQPGGGGAIAVSLNTFQTETFDFIATGTSSTLSFGEPGGSLANADGVGLDNVTVTNEGITPVPEPSQYAAAAVAFLGLLVGGRIVSRRGSRVTEELLCLTA